MTAEALVATRLYPTHSIILPRDTLTTSFLFALLNVLNKILKGEYINLKDIEGYLKHVYYNPPSLSNLSAFRLGHLVSLFYDLLFVGRRTARCFM